jgi:hypothetical protein
MTDAKAHKIVTMLIVVVLSFVAVSELVLGRNVRAVMVPFCESMTHLNNEKFCQSYADAVARDVDDGLLNYAKISWIDMWLAREPARSMHRALEEADWQRKSSGWDPDELIRQCVEQVNQGKRIGDASSCLALRSNAMRGMR